MSMQSKSKFNNWLSNNQFKKTTNDDRKVTHTCFAGSFGGSYCIDITGDNKKEFFEVLQDMYTQGGVITLNELRSNISRFYVDLDFTNNMKIQNINFQTDETILNNTLLYVLETFQKVIYKIYGLDTRAVSEKTRNLISRVVVLLRDSIGASKKGFYKNGVHFIWTNIYVNKDQALAIRETVLQTLDQDSKHIPEQLFSEIQDFQQGSTWADIIDKGVYNSGLRMPFAYKWDKKKNVGSSKPYLPVIVGSYPGKKLVLKRFCQDKHNYFQRSLEYATIRCTSTQEETECFDWNRVPTSFKINNSHTNKKTNLRKVGDSRVEYDVIHTIIKRIHPGYKDILLHKLSWDADNNMWVVHGQKNNQGNFCCVKNAIHKSNTVYFHVKMLYCKQLCFDTDCKARYKEYKRVSLTDNERTKLFPNSDIHNRLIEPNTHHIELQQNTPVLNEVMFVNKRKLSFLKDLNSFRQLLSENMTYLETFDHKKPKKSRRR